MSVPLLIIVQSLYVLTAFAVSETVPPPPIVKTLVDVPI